MTVLDVTNITPQPKAGYDPLAGKPYEDLVSAWFNNAGIHTFAPLQRLKYSEMSAKQTDLCFSWSERYVGRMEVKSRYSKPGKTIWTYPTIQVGEVIKVDCKVPEIDVMVVLCQRTGEAKACRADRKTIESKWLTSVSPKTGKMSYEVPRKAFRNLESVVKYINSVSHYFVFRELLEAGKITNEQPIYDELEDVLY